MRIYSLVLACSLVATAAPAAAQPAPVPVTLKATDGLSLKATYYAAGKPGPGLVLLHQCNRDRSAWAGFAKTAAARGFHVIAMDYRGFGESQGERFESFQAQGPVIANQWPADVDQAFTWLTAQPGVDRARIGAAGASCGVNQSVLLARRHPEVKTVVLLSGNVVAEGRQYLRETPSMPVLAAASEDDGNAIESMRWILGWSRNPSNKLVEYRAAGHGTDMFAVEAGLQPLMLDWFDKHLRQATTTAPAPGPAAPPSPVEQFWSALTKPEGAAKARTIYDAAKKKNAHTALFPENELNAHGYQLLQENKADEAILVFQMNADAYPESANTYDSLSDAYLAAGKKEEALRYAEKALAVLATDTRTPADFKQLVRESAEKKIKDLKK